MFQQPYVKLQICHHCRFWIHILWIGGCFKKNWWFWQFRQQCRSYTWKQKYYYHSQTFTFIDPSWCIIIISHRLNNMEYFCAFVFKTTKWWESFYTQLIQLELSLKDFLNVENLVFLQVCFSKLLLILEKFISFYLFYIMVYTKKINKCLSYFIPISIIPKILNQEELDLLIKEIVTHKNCEVSGTEIQT